MFKLFNWSFLFLLAITVVCEGAQIRNRNRNQIKNESCSRAPYLEINLPSLRNEGQYWPLNTEYLVIVHQYDGDINWASRLNFPHIIYEKNKPEKEPFNAINKAKGETNFLKFIAQFYDDLPANIIQVYQYEYKDYHDGSLVDLLNSPDFIKKYKSSKTRGFRNFNNIDMGSVAAQIPRMLNSGWWGNTMAPWFGDIHGYGNFTEGKRSCAQFVVSRERIRSLPQEFYANMYSWLVNNTIGEITTGYDPVLLTRIPTKIDSNINSNFYTSRYMEWSWELTFTSYKPSENIIIPFKYETTSTGKDPQSVLGSISAIYGANSYYRDVTHIVVENFIKGDKVIIPVDIDFNEYFTDVVYESKKDLILNVNNKEYKILQERSEDFIIELNETN